MSDYSASRALLIEPFVAYRKASNRWSDVYANTLLYFDRHCTEYFPDIDGISQEMMDSWCRQRPTETKRSRISRCQSAIQLVKYLRKRGLTEIVIPQMPPVPKKTHIPHAFTEEELFLFFQAADNRILSETVQTKRILNLGISVFFRLLYSSGIRTTEARRLHREDVDLQAGIINIRETKGDRQHYIALHDDAVQLLRDYNSTVEKYFPDRLLFFPLNMKDPDKPLSPDMLAYHFHKIWDPVNVSSAVPYDFRHNYAIENINSWTDAGFGFHDKLLYLSKSMGHTSLESTRYYYSIVPTLADIIEEKTSESFDDIVPEVPTYE